MSKLRAALVVLGDVMLVATVVLLLEIDKLVNGTLYGYGLVFSYDWAQPYWLMFRLSLVLIVVAVILISLVELPYPAFEEKTEEEAQGKTFGGNVTSCLEDLEIFCLVWVLFHIRVLLTLRVLTVFGEGCYPEGFF